MKKLIGYTTATTACQMMEALKNLVAASPVGDLTFVTINSDSIRMRLVEETLTDGSKVYDIELDENSKVAL